jgi:ABC-2 type transport system ATP-binding protein
VAAIETHALEREYRGGLKAVDGIDIAVEPGEVYGFLGPNGAGKTTTIRVLLGLPSRLPRHLPSEASSPRRLR